MTQTEINYAAQDIASSLMTAMKQARVTRVDFDMVRAAVAGFTIGAGCVLTESQRQDLEDLALRRFVEACA